MIEPKHNPPQVPRWVAVLVLLACVVGGGYFLYWWAWGRPVSGARPPASARQQQAVPDSTTRPTDRTGRGEGFGRVGRTATPTPGVPRTSGSGIIESRDSVSVRSGDTIMRVYRIDGRDVYSFEYASVFGPTSDFRMAERIRWRALNWPDARRAAGVTDEQLQQLRDLGNAPQVAIPADQRKQLAELFQAWRAADAAARPEAERTLLAKLERAGQEAYGGTMAQRNGWARQVRSILSPEQQASLRLAEPPPQGR